MLLAERHVTLKSRSQIERMRRAGHLVADVLDRLESEIRPGISTAELDALADGLIRAAGGVPSFIGVQGAGGPYRHAICVSVDDEIVHGIPGARRIGEGQVVSIDAGAIIDGWHGDAARSYIVGTVPSRVHELVTATREAMFAGIAAAQAGNHIGDVSAAVEDVALAHGLGIIREYVGHGIGTEMHEAPNVPNFRGPGRGRKLEPGLCLAIEPMLTLGSHVTRVKPDGWTVVTADGSLAAHWEHTIAITPDGPQILTLNEAEAARLPWSGSV